MAKNYKTNNEQEIKKEKQSTQNTKHQKETRNKIR